MDSWSPGMVGWLFTGLGLGLGVLLWAFGTWLARAGRQGRLRLPRAPRPPLEQEGATAAEGPASQEGVMIIRPGGRVVYLNAALRRGLGLRPEDRPSLETLTRRVRPPETFLALCSRPGHARLTAQHRLWEVASHPVPTAEGQAMMLIFRPVPLAGPGQEGAPSSEATLWPDGEPAFGQQWDVDRTVEGVLSAVDRLIPNDFLALSLWLEDQGQLQPYRFIGTAGLDHRVERGPLRPPFDDLRREVLSPGRTVWIPDLSAPQAPSPPPALPGGLRAYLALPLRVGEKVIGVLEVATEAPGALGEREVRLLQQLAPQAALALERAWTFTRTRREADLLSKLLGLAQRLISLEDPEAFVQGLVEGVGSLVPAEMVGLLLYHPATRWLEAQWPFLGVPRPFVEAYRTRITSQRRPLWEQLTEPVLLPNASEAPLFRQLGLADLARGAGMRDTLLIPLPAPEGVLGLLQISNRRGAPFGPADVDLAHRLAAYIAPAVENFTLLQQSRERARRAEALRRIANLVASEATVDEVLRFVLQELTQLLRASSAAVFLFDEGRGVLEVHRPSVVGVSEERIAQVGRLEVQDPSFRQTVTHLQRPFLFDDVQTDPRVAEVYRPLLEAFPEMHAVMVVPLSLRDRGWGELLVGHRRPHAFQQSDLQLAVSVAGQMALALERQRLGQQSDRALAQQAEALQTLLRLSRELLLAPSLESLMTALHEEAVRLTGAACATVKLLQEGRVLASQRCVTQQPEALTPREQKAVEAGEPWLQPALSPQEAPHPGVRAALSLPLLYRGEPVGLVDLHAPEAGAFDEDLLPLARSLAVQAALAVGLHLEREAHKRTLVRLTQRQEALHLLQGFFAQHALSEPPQRLLEEMGGLLAQGTGAGRWGLYVYREDTAAFHPLGDPADPALPPPLPRDRLPESEEHLEGCPVFPLPAPEEDLAWREGRPGQEASARWGALVCAPDGAWLGLLVLAFPPEAEEEPWLENLAPLLPALALLLQWHRLRERHAQQVRALEAQAHRFQTALQAAQGGLARWLRKDLEQMLEIHLLARGKERLETTLEIATQVNRQPERQAVFDALGHQLLERLAMDTVLLVDRVDDRLRLRQVYGAVPPQVHLESLLGQRNPLEEVMQTHQALLVGDLEQQASPWRDAPLLRRLQARSMLVIPIGTDTRTEAAVLAVSATSLPPFSAEDRQAFTLLGRQVGIALQSLNLLHETSRRLQEVDLLLTFSRQLGELDPRRLLNTLLDSALAVVRHAHAGFVALWNPRLERLQIETAQGYGEPERLLGVTLPLEGLMGTCYQRAQAQRLDEVDFVAAYPLDQEGLLRYQQATLDRLPVSALAVPIASGEHPLGVLVLENFNTAAAFLPEDENLLLALARQTGLMLENARLLEDAQARAGQLQALTNVAAIITSTLQSEEVLAALLPQLDTALPFDAATLWLREGDTFVVRDARGFSDEEERKGLRVALEDSALLKAMVSTQAPLLIPDIAEDTQFPWPQGYPYRSWLGLPLISQGEVIGLIVLEKAEPRFYTAEWVEVARTFAAQAAAALQNARLYEESLRQAQELRQRTERLELVYAFTAELSASLDPEYILSLTARRLREALNLDQVGMLLLSEEGLRLAAAAPEPLPHPWPPTWPALDLLEQMAESRGVLIAPQPQADPRLAPWQALWAQETQGAVVIFPLLTREVLHGVALALLPTGRNLSPAELDLGRSITQQAAVAFQNARLYEEMRHLTQDLERRVAERTQELTREHQRAQLLLRIITELASSLDLDQVLNRTLALMNQALGAEQSTILLSRPGEPTLFLRAARGYVGSPPPGGRPTRLPVEETLAGWVVRHREPVLVEDLSQDPRWKPGPEGVPPHRSAIVVPLRVGEDVLGAFCLFHRQPGFFSADHLDLAVAAARQVAVAINNAELFHLIRDQAERLGQEVRQREVEASRAKAILASVADGILVTDAHGQVTLFNASAERLLGIAAERIVGQPLERFSGLFGAAAAEWLATVQRWSADPGSYRPGEVYEQRLDLDDGRVLSVRLSPVLTSREFLGTVSVFRDITHQVEVDRLKSEFVATVSHELRTPMTAIKGYVELLLKGVVGPLNQQQQRFLAVVQANTERLSALVNDLLDISRIEAGKIAFVAQEVDLAPLIAEVLEAARQVALKEGREMAFEAEVPPDLPPVWGDPERLRQILENLVDNGYRYTPEGGRVTVRVQAQPEEVVVAVEDTGIGIPPEEQARVFERFYRGEHPLVMASAGTGLGLSIVRHLVEMHGGRIWVQSPGLPGQGSTFFFTLPLAQTSFPQGGGDGEDRDRGR